MLSFADIKELLDASTVLDPTRIRLSNKSFSVDAAEVISTRLSTFKSITTADLSDIIAGRPEDEALRTLKIICDSLVDTNLVELNLSDNALGSKGIHACMTVLVKKAIEVGYSKIVKYFHIVSKTV